MPLNRREWWVALAGSISVLTSCATARRSRSLSDGVQQVSDPQLARELALLAARPYSEIGVPVLLFGENLEGTDKLSTNRRRSSKSSQAIAQDLRRAFEQLSVAFLRIRPQPVPEDVASLIEWLAERDFGTALTSNGGNP